MGLRSLVSLGLLAIPIGATLGVLLGLDAYRSSSGQQPLFMDNSVKSTQYCQKAYGISPPSKGEQYTLNPNQWGWDEGEPGYLCMNVTAFNNNTYLTKTSAPPFSVTWQYPQGPQTQPVHAFPNIKLDGDRVFPTEISQLSEINVDVQWTYGVGTTPVASTDIAEMSTDLVNTNVAIDMFLDSDETRAQSSSNARYEVMVWLATFGIATEPIGFQVGALTTQVVNGTTFSLYSGQNSLQQYVLTWVASTTTEKFVGDIAPLLANLGRYNGPASTDYLGYMGLGSEALWSTSNVTFNVPFLSMEVLTR